jgi:hypothetical protein
MLQWAYQGFGGQHGMRKEKNSYHVCVAMADEGDYMS